MTRGNPFHPGTFVSFSPIPRQRQQPPVIQKGTSAPIRFPISESSSAESPVFIRRFSPRSTAAASEDPPPRPACAGICFSSSMRTPPEIPVSAKNSSAAFHMRFSCPDGALPFVTEREISPLFSNVILSCREILCMTLSIS